MSACSRREIADVGDVAGKRLLHLQCHIGTDTISWARFGASVTGMDFSPAAIAAARSLARDCGIEATFVEAGYDTVRDVLEGQFDVVYNSLGSLTWLPDLELWADVVAHYLAPGGTYYLWDMHPLTAILADTETLAFGRGLRYWRTDDNVPTTFEIVGDYTDRSAALRHTTEYDWQHSMGEIVTTLAGAGLAIDMLTEIDSLPCPMSFLVRCADGNWRPRPGQAETPLAFRLAASHR